MVLSTCNFIFNSSCQLESKGRRRGKAGLKQEQSNDHNERLITPARSMHSLSSFYNRHPVQSRPFPACMHKPTVHLALPNGIIDNDNKNDAVAQNMNEKAVFMQGPHPTSALFLFKFRRTTRPLFHYSFLYS